jgi:hypothetical protein
MALTLIVGAIAICATAVTLWKPVAGALAALALFVGPAIYGLTQALEGATAARFGLAASDCRDARTNERGASAARGRLDRYRWEGR